MVAIVGDVVVADAPETTAFDMSAGLLGGRQQDGRWIFPGGKIRWVQTLCERVFGHRGDNNMPFLRYYGPNEGSAGAVLTDAGLVVARITDVGKIELGAGMALIYGSFAICGEGESRRIAAGDEGAIVESVIASAYAEFLAAKVQSENQQRSSGRKRKSKKRR
jgi:hypothetical protein